MKRTATQAKKSYTNLKIFMVCFLVYFICSYSK